MYAFIYASRDFRTLSYPWWVVILAPQVKKKKPSLKSWVNHRFVVYIRYKLEYLGNTPPTSCHNWPRRRRRRRRRRRARKIPQHSNWSRANPWNFRCFICQVYQKKRSGSSQANLPTLLNKPHWQLFNGNYPSQHGIILTWSFSESTFTSPRWTSGSLGFNQTRIPPDKTVSNKKKSVYTSSKNHP